MIRLFHPQVYQGPKSFRHRKGYFEGWYYKFVSEENRAIAVIPGVSLTRNDSYAFIQTINGDDGTTTYTKFPIEEVLFRYKPFSVSIGDNFFSYRKVNLGDRIPVSGQVSIINPKKYKVNSLRPGIMGWYRYVPAMECYHGVVSTGHSLDGSLLYNGETHSLHNGKGYIEKDWGTSFPSSYIWMQSNNFKEKETSFMLSVAKIPWFGSSFKGFLGFLVLGDRTFSFSTYTGAELIIDSWGQRRVEITINGKGFLRKNALSRDETIKVRAEGKAVGELLAPATGLMDRRIGESINAELFVEYSCKGEILFSGKTLNSGLELVGELKELVN
jgi:hypothetical protein